jgi:vanillate monooxygenase ferredoxin subunit
MTDMDQLAGTLEVRVNQKWIEAVDICSLELVDTHEKALPAFSAGSHIDVHLPGGLIRQYSLHNDPTERHRYLISVLRDPNSRGGSKMMHEAVHRNSFLRISTPRNQFELIPAKRYLMFAGGIGVTPILGMAEQLGGTGADFSMHYCARSADRMAFCKRIDASSFRSRVHRHFDDGPERQRLVLGEILGGATDETHLYVCGPTGFMNWIIDTARTTAWSKERIHYEYFTSVVSSAVEGDFEVELASSGRILTIPADKTVALVLRENGVELPLSCEAGVCGTCLTRVLSGKPDHRDVFLTDEEHARNDQFTPCCSRALSSRLTLDL